MRELRRTRALAESVLWRYMLRTINPLCSLVGRMDSIISNASKYRRDCKLLKVKIVGRTCSVCKYVKILTNIRINNILGIFYL